MTFVISVIVGFVAGIISGFGIGGGTLLMVYMTAIAGIERTVAAGINLIYFIPTSAAALWGHIKNKLIRMDAAVPAVIAGIVTSAGGAWLSTAIDTGFIKKCFGVFLIYIGIRELFKKSPKKSP